MSTRAIRDGAAWVVLAALLAACASAGGPGGPSGDGAADGGGGTPDGGTASHGDGGTGGQGDGATGVAKEGGAGDGGGGADHDGGSAGDDGGGAKDAGGADTGGGSDGSASGGDAGSEGGPAQDGSIADAGSGEGGVVTDPFDPQSCPGPDLTEAQAATFFQQGAVQAVIGSYTIEMRQRSCNAVTGCGAWAAPATGLGAVLGGGTQPLGGTILLDVQGASVVLALQDHTEEKPYSMGTTCSAVDGTPETCGGYEYDIGDQWGGSGGLFPTMGELTDQASANVLLAGVLTSQCLRLEYDAVDANENVVQQFVVLAPVSPGPPLPPDPCPGGGTQMACGSAAAGQVTCCQNGLTTCPQSGCDCWGACN